MPLYDYDCAACGRRIEVVHGVHAPGPAHCPNCGGGPLKKAISAPAVHFKGSGWAKKERRATVAAGGGSSDTQGSGEGEGKADLPGKGADDPGKGGDGGGNGGQALTGVPPDTSRDAGVDKRPAASSRKTGAGTATKTD